MHYYIDGYNLLFRMGGSSEKLQTQREAVLEDLAKKAQAIDLSATIVFDAHHQPGPVSRGHYKNLEVVYTSERESADEYIHRAVMRIKNPRFITVVTSDKKLAWLCRSHGSNTESISSFLRWLNRRYQNESPPKEKQVQGPTKQVELPPTPPKPGTLSYYENIFLKEAGKIPHAPPKIKLKPAPKPKLTPKEQSDESDFDRWLRLFDVQ